MGVPVMYWSWQYECCGQPFKLGGSVDWPLALSYGEPWMPRDWMLDAKLRPLAEGDGHAIQLAHALAYAEEPIDEPSRAGIILYEEHHGGIPEGFPSTQGRVNGIHVVSVIFGDGDALPGTAELRAVNAVPELFHSGLGEGFRSEVGVLVDLGPTSA